MKKILPLLGCLIASIPLFAQKTSPPEYYMWSKEWKPTQKHEEAAYFARLLQVDDTTWQWDVYNYLGPRMLSEQYREKNSKQRHGRQMYHRPNGHLDSSGTMYNGMAEGDWYFYNDTGKAVVKKYYADGILVNTEAAPEYKNDSARKKDGEEESYFDGGVGGWQKFLKKNMQYPERALNANVMGTVAVQFEVSTEGKIERIDIRKSVEFSIDEEAIRLIRKSPKWVPARQKGELVRSYKIQPMVFRFK